MLKMLQDFIARLLRYCRFVLRDNPRLLRKIDQSYEETIMICINKIPKEYVDNINKSISHFIFALSCFDVNRYATFVLDDVNNNFKIPITDSRMSTYNLIIHKNTDPSTKVALHTIFAVLSPVFDIIDFIINVNNTDPDMLHTLLTNVVMLTKNKDDDEWV